MSPIEVVNSNRVVLAPIIAKKNSKIRTVKEKDSMRKKDDDNELHDVSSLQNESPGKEREEKRDKPFKREAKSACELRRKPWYKLNTIKK